MKKLLYLLFLLPILILSSCNDSSIDIITTNYIGYDLARGIVGDAMSVEMLLAPEEEIHGYSPSARDIRLISNAKVFIYVGGESEEWVREEIVPEINLDKTKVISLIDILDESDLLLEDFEDEYDEHIWTNPNNVIKMLDYIYSVLNDESYKVNYDSLIDKLINIDLKLKEITKDKDIYMVFADRFPLKYFVNEYSIDYIAGFKGCSASKEISAHVLKKLKDAIIEHNLKDIFVIELSDKKIAEELRSEIEGELGYSLNIRTIYSMHNISKDDFKNNVSYIELMERNIEVLKECF